MAEPIGLFGGTFDPIHVGHLVAAVNARHALDLVYPPRCGGCDRRGTLMCERCLSLIDATESFRSIERLDAVVSAGDFKEPLRSAIISAHLITEARLREAGFTRPMGVNPSPIPDLKTPDRFCRALGAA